MVGYFSFLDSLPDLTGPRFAGESAGCILQEPLFPGVKGAPLASPEETLNLTRGPWRFWISASKQKTKTRRKQGTRHTGLQAMFLGGKHDF